MHFDASGIIHAWDEYPIEHFPAFWQWIEVRIRAGTCRICEETLREVEHKYPECSKWLTDNAIQRVPLNDEILREANAIKELLEIEEESYGGGVDEIDLYVIAAAKLESEILLTTEKRQKDLSQTKKKNYKIPAVCEMDEVSVTHQNVREWILSSGEVFG